MRKVPAMKSAQWVMRIVTHVVWIGLLASCASNQATTSNPSRSDASPVATHVVPVSDWTPRQLTASLSGSGASFPNPLYQVLISVYTKHIVPTVQISYQSVGSGQGKKDFIAGLTDFGGTDSPISADDMAAQVPDAIHIPLVLGGVMPVYNLPSVTVPLRFSADTLVGIYMGDITQWNDARLVAENPDAALPDLPIAVVYRSDASGTTSIWTDYLSKVSADWKAKVGKGSSVEWLVGIGAPGNAGIASTVKNTEGAIGYVEVGYALSSGLPLPYIKNAAGNYVQPLLANISAAAAELEIRDDVQQLAQSITNSAAPQAYPIVAFTYILVHKDAYTDMNHAQALADFLYWGLTIGQDAAVRMGYAPLPTTMRHAAIQALFAVKVNGQAVIDAPVR